MNFKVFITSCFGLYGFSRTSNRDKKDAGRGSPTIVVPSQSPPLKSKTSSIPYFFHYSPSGVEKERNSWLRWGSRMKQAPTPLSKQQIESQGALFSVRDFQKIASSRIVNLFGQPFDPDRNPMLRALQKYHNGDSACTPEEKQDQLQEIKKTAQSYLEKKKTELTQREGTNSHSPLHLTSRAKADLNKDIQASKLLIEGAALEGKKLALERQKLLAEKSPCIIENPASQESPLTASGGMASLDIVTYHLKNETVATNTGYFKPVGSEIMDSVIGEAMGIPHMSTALANLPGRSVATYRISQLLGLSSNKGAASDVKSNLVPETYFACYDGKYGCLQAKAEGVHLRTTGLEDYYSEKEKNQLIVNSLSGILELTQEEQLEIMGLIKEAQKSIPISKQSTFSFETETNIEKNAFGRIGLCQDGVLLDTSAISKLLDEKTIVVSQNLINKLINDDSKEQIPFHIETGGKNLSLDKGVSIKKEFNTSGESVNCLYRGKEKLNESGINALIDNGKIKLCRTKIGVSEEIDFSNPCLQEELSNAQLLDFLTGQLDRHANNFIYRKEGDDWHIHLIDNDLSFPDKLTHLASYSDKKLDDTPAEIHRTLPTLISSKTAEKIMALDQNQLTAAMRESGLMKSEIEATLGRLGSLKEHLKELGKVRLVEIWDQSTFATLQEKKDNYVFLGVEDKKTAKREAS